MTAALVFLPANYDYQLNNGVPPGELPPPVFPLNLDRGNVNNPSTVNYTPPPKSLLGFPDAQRVPNKGRARWKTRDGRVLEWDSQHGDVEVYNRQGKHQGSADPNTGQMIKDPVPGRTTRN